MLRYFFVLILTGGTVSAAAPEAVAPVEGAMAACVAMQERFAGTVCSASMPKAGEYRLAIKAATSDAMRVVFMRSLDIADTLCGAGNKVELSQQLETNAGTRVIRWAITPPACDIKRISE